MKIDILKRITRNFRKKYIFRKTNLIYAITVPNCMIKQI